jgi:hypothetical protein
MGKREEVDKTSVVIQIISPARSLHDSVTIFYVGLAKNRSWDDPNKNKTTDYASVTLTLIL